MKLYAIVKDKYDKSDNYHFVSSDYKTKSDFIKDLKVNGFIILKNKVYTEQEYNDIEKE